LTNKDEYIVYGRVDSCSDFRADEFGERYGHADYGRPPQSATILQFHITFSKNSLKI